MEIPSGHDGQFNHEMSETREWGTRKNCHREHRVVGGEKESDLGASLRSLWQKNAFSGAFKNLNPCNPLPCNWIKMKKKFENFQLGVDT